MAQTARVSLNDGKLTVQAHNSDLTQILRDVASISGMTVDGLNKDSRVFGVYGPSSPRAVLTELLADAGYNFMMLGETPKGTPRELLLSAPSPAAALTPAKPAPPPTTAEDNPAMDSDQPALGPGAVSHPPPVDTDNSQDSNQRMQQTLQRLQQMHDQQQQNAPQ